MKYISTSKIVLLLLSCFALKSVKAQPSWQWGKRGGSSSSAVNSCCFEKISDMATDKNGNIYVLGSANMGINVDGHTHTGYGNNLSSGNIIVASWNCSGSFRWMKVIGSYTSSGGKSLRTDTLGGVYVGGYTISNNTLGYTHFDSDTALGNTNKSMFIVKYDTAGNYQWLRMPQADTVGPAAITYTGLVDMDVAPNGELFAFCYLNPGIYNGTYVVGIPGIYVYRYNASGTFLGGTPMAITLAGGSGGGQNLYNLQQSRFKRDHQNGRYYIAGHYDASFGTMTFGGINVNKASYIGCFSSAGFEQWTRQSATTNPAYETAGMISGRPAIDEQSNIYITGNTFNGQSFNGHTFTNTLSTLEWPCPFVAKLNISGNIVWAVNASVIGAANSYNITVANNELAITGNFYQQLKWDNISLQQGMNEGSDVFLARLNMQTGSVSGIDTLISSYGAEEMPAIITHDKKGNYYLGGQFFNDLTVAGNTLLNSGGETDWFVARFGAANCNCTVPIAQFTNSNGSGSNTINFSYTGTMPVDSVVWDFGNGNRGTGLNSSQTYAASGTYTVCATAYNSCGSNRICKTIATSGVGINEREGLAGIRFFPNPVTGILSVDGLQEPVQFVMYNSLGSALQQGTLSEAQASIDMHQFLAGLYVLALQNKNGAQQRIKVVKR
ncbi:hypothetical protein DBR32_06400 [Taibaiella sp. KBW10]|uniref:PKD domain-containing protein n=1 Tax=Taibaiella sp. KBW10 TaxID=2153357 RepID=UPI000F5A17F8|nr:PKD domain-containing protein [Taibaiella sp. KBW10]RQO31584.1 hypothetical protein DBR32_06400 [Taibaiella sp. KBW10]